MVTVEGVRGLILKTASTEWVDHEVYVTGEFERRLRNGVVNEDLILPWVTCDKRVLVIKTRECGSCIRIHGAAATNRNEDRDLPPISQC